MYEKEDMEAEIKSDRYNDLDIFERSEKEYHHSANRNEYKVSTPLKTCRAKFELNWKNHNNDRNYCMYKLELKLEIDALSNE